MWGLNFNKYYSQSYPIEYKKESIKTIKNLFLK